MKRKHGCALLAGGEGKRFGYQNKALLKAGEKTFLENTAEQMKMTGFPCYLSSAFYDQQIPEGFCEVKDIVSDAGGKLTGPMGGIYSCLLKAKEDGLDGLFFAPCDAAFYSIDLIEKLLRHVPDREDAVIWQTPDQKLQTVFSYYSVSCLGILKSELEARHYKLLQFYEKISWRAVSSTEMNVPEIAFTNINTVEDYKWLQNKSWSL